MRTKAERKSTVMGKKQNSKKCHTLHFQNMKFSYFHYVCHHPQIITSIIVIHTIIITITITIFTAVSVYVFLHIRHRPRVLELISDAILCGIS